MIRVVWDPRLRLKPSAEAEEQFISLRKPSEVLEPWLGMELDLRAQHGMEVYALGEGGLATRAHLARVHDLNYIESVFSRAAPNGFGNTSPTILGHVLAANGVMVQAVKSALLHPRGAVCAPVSGFHHAGYSEGAGFCTFNGLLAAVQEARFRGMALRNVLIIDGDAHYGDGTDDILRRTGIGGITNLTHRDHGANMLQRSIWEQTIRGLLINRDWDLVLYQAGADAHEADPYGSGYLTDEDWRVRDELVFMTCRARRLPLVFNFAGGYNGDKTIELHRSTLKTAMAAYKSSELAV